MTDPALEAARRAWDADNDLGLRKSFDQLPPENSFVVRQVGAAREALKPIRELHARAHSFVWPGNGMCDECQSIWPCSTAGLIYTTEELNR